MIKSRMEEIRRELMTYQEYLQTKVQLPYLFTIEKNEQYLYYFGSNHSSDPNNEQYDQLRKFWAEFSSRAAASNSIVFNEGGLRKPYENEVLAITFDAEAGFITSLAYQKGYTLFSPEPSRKKDEALLANYSKEEIQYYYFARMVNQWARMHERPTFEAYITPSLEYDKRETGWNDFDFSLENMKSIHQKLFHGTFDPHNPEFFYSITNPTTRTTVINCFSQDQGKMRDAFIVSEILNEWKNGKSLFIVYGFTHCVMQEPALRKLIN